METKSMLVSYIWDIKEQNTTNKWNVINNEILVPIGCVVATDKYEIGVSICHPNDPFNKKRAKQIAMGRAENHTSPNVVHRKMNTGVDLEFAVEEAVELMKVRSEKYFK